MVRRVYGHLGEVRIARRPWSTASSSTRLSWVTGWRLHSGTTIDTTRVDSQPYRVSEVAATSRA